MTKNYYAAAAEGYDDTVPPSLKRNTKHLKATAFLPAEPGTRLAVPWLRYEKGKPWKPYTDFMLWPVIGWAIYECFDPDADDEEDHSGVYPIAITHNGLGHYGLTPRTFDQFGFGAPFDNYDVETISGDQIIVTRGPDGEGGEGEEDFYSRGQGHSMCTKEVMLAICNEHRDRDRKEWEREQAAKAAAKAAANTTPVPGEPPVDDGPNADLFQ